jgi:hypothetical protein
MLCILSKPLCMRIYSIHVSGYISIYVYKRNGLRLPTRPCIKSSLCYEIPLVEILDSPSHKSSLHAKSDRIQVNSTCHSSATKPLSAISRPSSFGTNRRAQDTQQWGRLLHGECGNLRDAWKRSTKPLAAMAIPMTVAQTPVILMTCRLALIQSRRQEEGGIKI